MPQETKIHGQEPVKLEGRRYEAAGAEEVAHAIDLAFDYRGDVTLELTGGLKIEGYIFNREPKSAEPYLEVFPRNADRMKIPYRDVRAVTFSGEDTAFGKSWDAWIKKNTAQRKAEAERQAAEAQARGHL